MNHQSLRYQTILFDIDGVMLSEERYFDGSALTVYELLCSEQYMGCRHSDLPAFRTEFSNDEMAHIRRATFTNDTVFETMKARGINANWDMVYLQVSFHIAGACTALKEAGATDKLSALRALASEAGWTHRVVQALRTALQSADIAYEPDFGRFNEVMADCKTKAEMFERLEQLRIDSLGPDSTPFGTNRALWMLCQSTFQEWYLGDDYVETTRQPGKRGFLSEEVPIVPPAELKRLFSDIRSAGGTIGIATGRPEIETAIPLQFFDWMSEFTLERVSTASDVLNAEIAIPEAAPLAKPNPFSYHRSYMAEPDARRVLADPLPIDPAHGSTTLVVGDSVADLLAARALGCRFAAVLTGLEGERARPQFEERGADYILSDVLGLREVIGLG